VLSLPGYFYFPSPAKKTPGAAIMAGSKTLQSAEILAK
jgi:hypothetical protein